MNLPKVILFDWDGTLWDFRANANDTLRELILECQNDFDGEEFIAAYHFFNEKYWEQYQQGKITQTELRAWRFRDALARVRPQHADNVGLATWLKDQYVERCPQKKKLIAGAEEVLEYAKQKGIRLAIATNGFAEVQEIKIKRSGLAHYFEHVFTPHSVGHKKPSAAYFMHCCGILNTTPSECWMVGDELLTDVIPAEELAMRGFWLRHPWHKHKTPKRGVEITSLRRLVSYLE